tara:strand:+ start:915 stop:1727 length:813 start_codon:yes stop_codon:yes gene_type:complete
MSKLHITGNKVHILSGGKIEMTSPTFTTDFVFPTTATETGENLGSSNVQNESNLASNGGGEATLKLTTATDVVAVELGGFNFTGSNAIPSNANITKVEFAYNSRMVKGALATNPSVVGNPAVDLTYQLSIGFFVPNVSFLASFGTPGWDPQISDSAFTVHAPVSSNETYPSEPTIENFSHLASEDIPSFISRIIPSYINGSDTFSIKLGRLGGRFVHNSTINPTISGLIETNVDPTTDGTGQSVYTTYDIGLNRDSNGPALKVHYNFSPS